MHFYDDSWKTSVLDLTEDEKEMLRELVSLDRLPGPIVADFQTLLDYAGENSLTLTQSHLPPTVALNEINALLTHPIQHGLTRPRIKSFPNVAGLYLLLRATGIGIVKTTKNKPQLILDDVTLASWQALNPVERYLMLLESWLLRGNPQILGERASFHWRSPLVEWQGFFMRIQRGDWPPTNAPSLIDTLRYFPGLNDLALMEMFGFVKLVRLPPVPGKGWEIKSLTPTLLGKLMLKLLLRHASQDDIWFQLDDPQVTTPGKLQPFLQGYFPEWQNILVWPESDFRDGIFIFKVSLAKNLWRTVAISGEHDLDALSAIILSAYDFDNDHLYRFIYKNRSGIEININHPFLEDGKFTSEVRVGDLPLAVGDALFFNFDFGDDWYFELTLEQIDSLPKGKRPRPKILEKKGTPPKQYPGYDEEE